MQRKRIIQVEYQEEIEDAQERFGDHEGMVEARIVRWLAQFPDEDVPLAIDVIRAVRYVNASNLRAMTRQLFQIVSEELEARGYDRAAFVAVGDAGSGSGTVARVLRELTRNSNYRMASMIQVAQLPSGEVDAIVFVDDFSGTGRTLEKWWENVEPIVRPTNAAIFVGLLIINDRARQCIEGFADVLAVEELAPTADVFAPESIVFSDDDKARLLKNCRRTACGPKYERGFGECGLLLAFKHGCPNNSLPILWYRGDKWRPLFNRRAI